MRNYFMFAIAAALLVALFSYGDDRRPVAEREGIKAMLQQLDAMKKDPKTTADALSSIKQSEMFLQDRLQNPDDKEKRSVDPARIYADFKSSPAYGFLDAAERRQLAEMISGKHVEMPHSPHSRPLPIPSDLRIGDLVFRREDAFLSRHFVEASQREKRFSHVGVIVGIGIHPVIVTVGESVDGACAQIGWDLFCSHASDCAVYRFKGEPTVGERIAKAAEKRIGIPFDPAFDLKTKDRLYCSELVRDAVNEAVGKTVIGTTKKGTFEYVAIDDCYRSGWIKVYDAKDGK